MRTSKRSAYSSIRVRGQLLVARINMPSVTAPAPIPVFDNNSGEFPALTSLNTILLECNALFGTASRPGRLAQMYTRWLPHSLNFNYVPSVDATAPTCLAGVYEPEAEFEDTVAAIATNSVLFTTLGECANVVYLAGESQYPRLANARGVIPWIKCRPPQKLLYISSPNTDLAQLRQSSAGVIAAAVDQSESGFSGYLQCVYDITFSHPQFENALAPGLALSKGVVVPSRPAKTEEKKESARPPDSSAGSGKSGWF